MESQLFLEADREYYPFMWSRASVYSAVIDKLLEFFVSQNLLDEFPKCFIVGADNVGSTQMQQIRISLRGSGIVLMGKNTMMRKAIRGHIDRNPSLEK